MKKRIVLILTFLVSLGGLQLYAQSRSITGNISNTDKETLIGATVQAKNSTEGVTSDVDGNFTITVSEAVTALVISYTGYESQEVSIVGVSEVKVVLEEAASILDEVVVSALGFKEKRDEQGSTSSIVSTKLVQSSGEATFANSLSGKASGVQIIRPNGDPGAGSSIKIRGANTIDGSSQPLIIVDGVPMDNSTSYGGGGTLIRGRQGGVSQGSRMNDINPADIESIQILKGASAAALWGSRAANGVIVITTKNGKSGKAKVTFKSTYSLDQVAQRIEMQDTWGQGVNGVYSPTASESWGDYIPNRSGAADVYDESGERFIADDGTVYYPILEKNSRETFVEDNWNDVFQNGHFLQNDLTVSGGSDKSTYFFSLGNLSQDGIIKQSSYNRTNLRLNYNAYLNDWLTISNKAAYTLTRSNRIQQSQNVSGLMLGLTRTPADFSNADYRGTYIGSDGVAYANRHRSYRRYLGNSINPTYNNPLWTAFEQEGLTEVNRFTVTPQITIAPTSWLQIITRANADIAEDNRRYFFPVGSAGEVQTGVLNEDAISTRDLNLDVIGKANFKLSKDIDLTVTAGWSLNDSRFQRNTGRITGFLVNSTKPTTSLNTSAEASIFEKVNVYSRSNRGYGVLDLDLFDQLYVKVSGALEASSTINGAFFYPAVDLAWNFTKSALKTEFLSFGKLRASFGRVGVQPAAHRFETLSEGSFSYATLNNGLNIDLFGGGFRVDNNLGNADLAPEIKTEFEVGTDLRFLDNKLSFSFTYYQNQIEGILLNVNLTPSSGYSTQYGNFGAMENKGIEMDLGYTILQKDDWDITTSINWSRNENLVTDLFGTESIVLGGGEVASAAVQGYPLGVIFGTGSQTDENGDFILDENGFPQLTNGSIVLGDPNPDWRGGLSLNISYKKFRLTAVIEHSQGGVFNPRTLHVLNRFGTTMETANLITLDQNLENYAGDVILAGTTVRGNIKNFGGGPVLLDESWYRLGIGGGLGANQAYNFNIYDATFTKVRELTLSYTIDEQLIKSKKGFESIVISVSGRNLININQVPGIDPEINQNGVGQALGIEYFTNPQTKSYLFSALFNF
jgi:TonB-linked SusC/RagA family outer membrane protein